MKVLITGAAGFIGYHLSKMLIKKSNTDVIGVDNFYRPSQAKVNCLKGDIRDFELMEELVRDRDIVYHLAAQTSVAVSHLEPRLTHEVNVIGTKNILESCSKYDKKLIFASSCEVYGNAQSDSISENHPLNPHSPYAKSKLEAEKLCLKYFKKGLRVSILRSFNTYGPFQAGAVIPLLVDRIYHGKQPEISGDGRQTRDFMYIDDALRTYEIISISDLYGQPINFGTGVDTSINDLVNLILCLMNSSLEPIYTDARVNEVERFKAGTSLAKKMGFEEKVSLEEGLKKYISWFKAKNT